MDIIDAIRDRRTIGKSTGEIARETVYESIEESARAAFIEGEAAKPLRAPMLIVASTRTDPNPVRAEEDLTATAAAVQNLLLAAHAKGLSAAWKTGKIVYDPAVKAFLGLHGDDRIVAIVYLGAVALEAAVPRERDARNCVRWIESGVPA